MWKWALRPDLRSYDLTKEKYLQLPEDEKIKAREERTKNSRWMVDADQEEIAQRLLRCMKNASYKLPNGGFRKGIFQEYLHTLQTPQQLNVVIQALNVWQQRQFKKTKDQVNSIPDNISALVCKAAARVGAPDLGLSYIQMAWIKTNHPISNIHHLLRRYAEDAENWILLKKAAGLPIESPPNYKEIRALQPNKILDKDDEEEEEEEEEISPEDKEKQIKLFFNHWINCFMQTYREARSDKYPWSPNAQTYGYVARFYSCVGDCDAALQIYQAFSDIDEKALDIIILGLVCKNRIEEAHKLINTTKNDYFPGKLATYLALNDRNEVINNIQSGLVIKDKKIFRLHFGIPERIHLLQSIASKELKEFESDEVEYLFSFEQEQQKEQLK